MRILTLLFLILRRLRVPSNCTFEVDDITKPWMWNEPFDFIHSQNVGQGVHNWPEYVGRIYEYVYASPTPVYD